MRLIHTLLLLSTLYLLLVGGVFAGCFDSVRGFNQSELLKALFLLWSVPAIFACTCSGMRHRRPETLLALGVCAFCLALIEVACRLAFPHLTLPATELLTSKHLSHVLPGNRLTYSGKTLGEKMFVQTNEDGFRSTYSPELFKNSGERIVILGDSFTFGLFVDRPFPAILEKVLRGRLKDSSVAVLNAGQVSYSPFMYRRMIDSIVAKYAPTLVLICLDATDIGDDYNYRIGTESARVAGDPLEVGDFAGENQPIPFMPVSFIYQRFLKPAAIDPAVYILRLLRANLSSGPQPDTYSWVPFVLQIDGQLERSRYFIFRHPLDLTRPYFDETLENVRTVAAKSTQAGAKFALIVLPRFIHYAPDQSPGNWEIALGQLSRHDPYRFAFFEFFEAASSSEPYPIFSLLRPFEDNASKQFVFSDDSHWNPAGHEFVAETIAAYLLESGLVQR